MGMGLDELEFKKQPSEGTQCVLEALLEKEREKSKILEMRLMFTESQLNGVLRALARRPVR